MQDAQNEVIDGIFEFDDLAKTMLGSLSNIEASDFSDPFWLTATHHVYFSVLGELQKSQVKVTPEQANQMLVHLLQDDQHEHRERILTPLSGEKAKIACALTSGIIAWHLAEM